MVPRVGQRGLDIVIIDFANAWSHSAELGFIAVSTVLQITGIARNGRFFSSIKTYSGEIARKSIQL